MNDIKKEIYRCLEIPRQTHISNRVECLYDLMIEYGSIQKEKAKKECSEYYKNCQ